MQKTRHETLNSILEMVDWLRNLPNPHKAPCSDSAIYWHTERGQLALGQVYKPGDTVPRIVKSGKVRLVANLNNLPPRRVARFLKINRKALVDLVHEGSKDPATANRIIRHLQTVALNYHHRYRAGHGPEQ